MKNEYPFHLFPELPEAGQEEAQKLIDKFKEALKKAADEVISDLYCGIVPYIESDSWTNFRNQLMYGFRDYKNRKIQSEYDFKKIREQIFKEYRDDLIKDLDQDMVKEIESLKKTIESLQEMRRRNY